MPPENNGLFITVFTPVYNRGYCVRNVYESLVEQSFKNFEWLVINDGSTDNTDEVINSCIQEEKISIRYYKQSNGGQHRALNRAIELAHGYMLMIVDSDDDLKPFALERIKEYEKTISSISGFAGVAGLRCDRAGKVIGMQWHDAQKDFIDATNIERYKYNILLGDKAEAYYTNVLKMYYPIPEFENENDVEKGVLWNRIAAANLRVRWFNEAIYNCEYLNDGMSKNIIKNYMKNMEGYLFYIKEFLNYDIGWKRKIKTLVVTCEIARSKHVSPKELAAKISCNIVKTNICYVLSYVSVLRYPIRRIFKKSQI